MPTDPPQDTIPTRLQFLSGLCILGTLIVTPIVLAGYLPGPVLTPRPMGNRPCEDPGGK